MADVRYGSNRDRNAMSELRRLIVQKKNSNSSIARVDGRLPRGIGIERLRDPPTEWSRQFEA